MKQITLWKRLLTVAMVSCLACMSFAPFKDMRRDVKLDPERSESQRAQDQYYQSVQGEMAPPPADTEAFQVVGEGNDAGSASTVASANKKISPEDSEAAGKNALIEANQQINARKRPSYTWVWALVLGGVGLGSVFAVRQYANKALPEMPTTRSKNNW